MFGVNKYDQIKIFHIIIWIHCDILENMVKAYNLTFHEKYVYFINRKYSYIVAIMDSKKYKLKLKLNKLKNIMQWIKKTTRRNFWDNIGYFIIFTEI